jgi:hypothetical protein
LVAESFFLYVLVALQLGDIWTTQYALQNIRGAVESNPIVKKAMDKLGVLGGLFAIKTPFIVILIFYPLPLWALAAITALYVYVVGNNARIIFKHR